MGPSRDCIVSDALQRAHWSVTGVVAQHAQRISAQAKGGGYQLILVFAVNYQHALRLTRAAIDFRCGSDSVVAVSDSPLPVHA
jgi:hypothetical protein